MIELQGEVERRDGGSLEEAFDVGTLSVTSSVSSRGPRTHVRIQAARPRPCQPRPPLTDCLPTGLQGDTVLLTIGYHQLEGKRLPLKKPLAVLEKHDGASQSGGYKVRCRGPACGWQSTTWRLTAFVACCATIVVSRRPTAWAAPAAAAHVNAMQQPGPPTAAHCSTGPCAS